MMHGTVRKIPEEPRTNCGIAFQDDDHPQVWFNPRVDITPLESALIAQFFVTHTIDRSGIAWSFLEKHGLMRHFTEEKPE